MKFLNLSKMMSDFDLLELNNFWPNLRLAVLIKKCIWRVTRVHNRHGVTVTNIAEYETLVSKFTINYLQIGF